MKKNKRIVIIGHFGGDKEYFDGQTVKTKILYNELSTLTDWKIKVVDTYYKKVNPIRLLVSTFFNIITTHDIIVLVSKNGLKMYIPILYFFRKYFHKNIYHDVIGGNLHNYIIENPKLKKYLNSFNVNWVETNKLKVELEKLNIHNCDVIPNFKRLTVLSESNLLDTNVDKKVYKFCTFSRVIKEKGISDAANAIIELNKKNPECISYMLDVYGPIDESYKNEFEKILLNNSSCISYKGIVEFNKSTEILKNYDVLLFPTYWSSEGFPGTIIDAFSAGVPVIATDWNCNSEIITNNINGIIYPNENEKTLTEAIKKIEDNQELFYAMKKNCIIEAEKYKPEKYMEKIIAFINNC